MSKLRENQEAFLLDFCKVIVFAIKSGFTVTSGELLRTAEQQAIYVRTGRSKTLNSNHLKKLAGDLNFFKNGKYICSKKELQEIGDYWESLHPLNKWGGNYTGNFKDAPHFERRFKG